MGAMRAVKAALLDLNGTLHVGGKEVPGSVQALQRLRDAGVKVRFVSNTTKDTTANLVKQMRGMGFPIHESEVFTSIAAAKSLVRRRSLRPFLLLQPQALPEFGDLATDEGPHDAVVVGLAKQTFSFDNMNKAFHLLLDNPSAPLIAIHKGRYCREPDGTLSLGPGPFVAALEYATGRTCEIVGKPEASFFQLALDDLGVDASDAVMVGDDARDDVGGAQRAGLQGLLVQTGKYRPGDETAHGIVPDAVVKDFAGAVECILSRNAT